MNKKILYALLLIVVFMIPFIFMPTILSLDNSSIGHKYTDIVQEVDTEYHLDDKEPYTIRTKVWIRKFPSGFPEDISYSNIRWADDNTLDSLVKVEYDIASEVKDELIKKYNLTESYYDFH